MTNPNDQVSVLRPSEPSGGPTLLQMLKEYRLMQDYALSEGLPIDKATQEAIEAVPSQPQASDFATLLKAHVALTKIVAPATPLSLEATEPLPGPLSYLRRPPLVMWMISFATVAVLGFVITDILRKEHYHLSETVLVSNWFFAAMLGAVFYVLFTALGYVKNRTYDPRYDAVYVIRFALGILAGLILAMLLSKYILSQGSKLVTLGPAVLALLGGFSTEAVYQILQRLVDVLLAAVRGDGSSTAKAKASKTVQKEVFAMADDSDLTPELRLKLISLAKRVAG